MAEKVNKPQIRFEGFTDAWKLRKLGEIVEIKDSARIPNNEWSDIGVPYIRASDISSKNLKGTLFISSERYEFYKNKTGAPMRGDVLFNGGGEIGKSIICNDSKPIYVQGGAVLYARTSASNELEASYLKTYYETSHSRKYIDAASAGGTMKHFTLKPAQEMPVYLPEAEEQKQIGDFYICIDNLITLHQRKYDKLQILKKAMLEKMFPKNGSSVPEIRFKGFTDAWEQRKLGEVFEEYSEKNHEELPPLTIIQGGGTIRRDESERALQYDKSSLSNYKMVNKDDFIVHLRSFEGGLEKANSQGIISPAYHTFHGENVDSRFFYAYFRSKNFINKDLKPHVYGIRDGRSIDIEGMKTIKIPYTAYAEQKSIGDFLTALDNLITLHQRKLDTLKYLKEAMLEKMFV